MGKLLPKGKFFAIGPDGELLDVTEITPDQTETISEEEIDDKIAYLALNSSETITVELDPESSSVIHDLVDDIEKAWAELIALPATKMQ